MRYKAYGMTILNRCKIIPIKRNTRRFETIINIDNLYLSFSSKMSRKKTVETSPAMMNQSLTTSQN